MSWLTHSEPSLADIEVEGGEMVQPHELATRNSELQALLATEREAHRQAKEQLAEVRLLEKENLYKVRRCAGLLLLLLLLCA